ncbi:UNVERIFIED_CONTAM: hypothetical protein Scaly_2791000 [Sesamum calycinum]|uniref:Retrovirus-related Pol polyprotein from transposon TNT 1-94 n=1 Tax=Sesamum calycinum TaxID=2727403 RepID=A0AAW2IWG7_9LAMI
MLNGDNFSDWKDQVLLTLGCMDLDLAFRVDEPPIPTDSSKPTEKASYELWQQSNRLSLMLIKKHISKGIRGSIPKCTKVKDFLKAIEDQYVCSDKALTSTLMKRLSDVKINGSRSVREYIMHMRDIAAQLKPLEVDISEPFLVHLIVKSLRKEYGPFKITYNAQKKKWPVNELLTMCVQEEERLKNENIEVANPVTQNKGKGKKGKFGPYEKKTGNMSNEAFGNKITCFFCRKTGHKKKDCPKYKKWLEKKGNLISCVCYESNFVKVPDNTWWIDSGSTIHIANTMQGFLSLRKPMGSEQNIYSGNQMRSQVEDVGTFRLVFKNGYVLDLKSPFAAFLKEEGIIAQYTMPGTPQQNGVAERRNRTLMDMDSFRIIMALVAHFDSEVHQMDMKTTFLNGDLEEEAVTKAIQELNIGMLLRRIHFLLANGAISWKSTKQTITASSTMEAEFVACYEATSQALWLRHFITGLKIVDSIFKPIQIFCNNSAVVFFSKNNKSGSRNKHIDIKYLVVREKVNKKEIVIQHNRTELMVVDPMTKALSANSYRNHVDRMGLVNPM